MLRGITREPDGSLDPRPQPGSPLLASTLSGFPGDAPAGFFESVGFRGAFGEGNWLNGWSWLSRAGYLTPLPVVEDGDDYDAYAASFTPPLGARGADDDKDGLTNEFEYRFGLNPTSGASATPITVGLSAQDGTFTYTRRNPDLSKVAYIIETSTDLATWSADAGAVQTVVSTTGNIQTVKVQTAAAPAGGRLFVRVKTQ
jgi:hypothetical protein